MFRLGRPSPADLDRVLESARRAGIAYPGRGGTVSGAIPGGFRHERHRIELPLRPDAFDRACEGLRHWVPHRSIGATVTPDDPPNLGATVVVALRRGPVTVLAPCRIVAVVDAADRCGFA